MRGQHEFRCQPIGSRSAQQGACSVALESAGEQNDPTRRDVQLIARTELNERIREWGIWENVIETDYVMLQLAGC